jgi:hypothetical protein
MRGTGAPESALLHVRVQPRRDRVVRIHGLSPEAVRERIKVGRP